MADTVLTDPYPHIAEALTQWDIPPVTAIDAVAKHVFKLTTAGTALRLKISANAPDLRRLAWTEQVLAHVAQRGLRVPLLIPARNGQRAVAAHAQWYLLAEWIPADMEAPDPALQGALFFHTGAAIARLHQALASYPDPHIQEHTWREDLARQLAPWLTALRHGLPAPQAAVIDRIGQARGAAIGEALRELPEQLIHRDCHPGNVLVQGTTVVGFIDCDHLCVGPRLFDLAYYAVHHLKWVTDDAVATQRWLRNLPELLSGYQQHQPLLPTEVAAFPACMLAYHLLLAHWFMKVSRPEEIALEIKALDWIDRHFDAILHAVMVSASTERVMPSGAQ
jgi:Ser/Thr protein kinase RdoA (MazF antagonist)